jgi:transposase
VPKRRKVLEDGIWTSTESQETCHNVRACIDPQCRIVWNRDVNAARNMAWICISIARGSGRPVEFTRAG